jgi:hypothetical protein
MFVPGVNGSIIANSNAPTGSRLKGAYKNSKNSKKRKMPNGGITSGPETSTPTSPERMQPVYIKANTRVGNKEYTKRGTTADREMNTLTNSASKVSDFFGNMFSKIVGNNPQLAAGVATTAKGVNRVAQKVGDVSKETMFNNYRPVSYPSIPEAIGGLFGNSAPPARDQEGDYSIGEEAWRTALGLPTKSKYLSPSKYKPSNSEDPNAEYYSLNNVYDPQKLINAYMDKTKGKPGESVQMKSLAPFVSNPALNSEDLPFSETDPVQQFKLSQGTDKKGDYVSMYDTYDFNMPLMDQVVYGSNRKPYDFYDRFYYKKDASGKPVYMKQKNGGKVDHSDDKDMVNGVASILRRVESKSNRLKLANQLSKQFNREKVKYDLASFLNKSKVKK